MVVTSLSSLLQPQPDTKVIPDEKATLMTGGFLLADSMPMNLSQMSNKEVLVLFIYKPA